MTVPVLPSQESLFEHIAWAATAPVLAVDTEGNGIDVRPGANPAAKTTGISIGHRSRYSRGEVTADYYPFQHTYGNLPDNFRLALKALIETHPRLVFHNLKHDRSALANLGINVPMERAYCTMMEVTWTNEELPSKSLDYCSKAYGGNPKAKPKELQRIIDTFGWGNVPWELIAEYAATDARITLELDEKVYPVFKREGYDGPLWDRERRFIKLVTKMESMGIAIDQDMCTSEIIEGELVMDEIRGILGLNPASTADLEELLLNRLGLPPSPEVTPQGRPSFNKKAMEWYDEELALRNDETAKLVLEFRGWQKTVSSNYRAYLDLLSPDGYLRPNFKLHGTRSGRLSCEKPNLQQIPRKSGKRWNGNLKKAFLARPGYGLWEFDYSNLELRMSTVYSRDPLLLYTFQNGLKPFDIMAEAIFGSHWTDEQRQAMKVQTYMTLYGSGILKIARTLGIPLAEAQRRKAEFTNNYAALMQASRRASRIAEMRGYLKYWTGRRRHLRNDFYKAFNSVIQGGCAEMVKDVMLDLDELIDWDECKMLLQVHDSILFEIKKGTEDHWFPIIRTAMQDVAKYNPNFGIVPFPVESKPWAA